MVLKSHDLLTIDATIIAGLMVLLSIQSTTQLDNSQFEQMVKHEQDLKDRQQILSKLLSLNLKDFNSNSNIDSSELKTQLTAKAIELKEIQIELNKTGDLDEQSLSVFQQIINNQKSIFSLVNKIVTMMMLLPFISSAGMEVFTMRRRDSSDIASNSGMVLMYVGFASLFIGLVFKLFLI